jgi:predicted outer membrane repeat protein
MGNQSPGWGGAIYADGALTVVNSLLAWNSADLGGAILNTIGSVHVEGCTIFGNAARTGGGIESGGGARVAVSLLWGNHDQGGFLQSSQIYSLDPAQIQYSIVQNWSGSLGGVGNSGADPMFVDADGADDIPGTEDDDLRLLPGSPAINGGDPDYCLDNVELCHSVDLDRHARVLCGRVDIGAYEFGIGDYDCNQSVDLTDFSAWQSCMTDPSATAVPAVRGHNGSFKGPQSTIANRQSTIGCEAFDFNADGAVDLLDLAAFQRILTP